MKTEYININKAFWLNLTLVAVDGVMALIMADNYKPLALGFTLLGAFSLIIAYFCNRIIGDKESE